MIHLYNRVKYVWGPDLVKYSKSETWKRRRDLAEVLKDYLPHGAVAIDGNTVVVDGSQHNILETSHMPSELNQEHNPYFELASVERDEARARVIARKRDRFLDTVRICLLGAFLVGIITFMMFIS